MPQCCKCKKPIQYGPGYKHRSVGGGIIEACMDCDLPPTLDELNARLALADKLADAAEGYKLARHDPYGVRKWFGGASTINYLRAFKERRAAECATVAH